LGGAEERNINYILIVCGSGEHMFGEWFSNEFRTCCRSRTL
jgi:hypothetical protein